MRLTADELDMVEGRRGPVLAKAMEIQVKLGEIFGAESMVPIDGVHMPGSSIVVSGRAGLGFVEYMGTSGGFFSVPTTLNPAACDLREHQQVGFDARLVALQRQLTQAYEVMGGFACHTCTPYSVGRAPRFGEHLAWGESSAIAFANSVLGARTNREGGPSALAAALAGRVPAYGYHLDENRHATRVVDVRVPLRSTDEFGSLGYFVGADSGNAVPLFVGIERASLDQLKMLGAALAASGSVALFHIAGITAEAASGAPCAVDQQSRLPRVEVDGRALAATAARLDGSRDDQVGIVVLGCPHLSLEEIKAVAEEISGSQIDDSVVLWLLTALPNVSVAERAGWAKIITDAGGRLVVDTCPVLGAIEPLVKSLHAPVIATNSAKLAHYAPGKLGLQVHYGSAKRCLDAALEGRWR